MNPLRIVRLSFIQLRLNSEAASQLSRVIKYLLATGQREPGFDKEAS